MYTRAGEMCFYKGDILKCCSVAVESREKERKRGVL